MSRLLRTLAPIGALLLAGGLITGCGADRLAESAVERAAESGSDGKTDVDIDTDKGEIKIETSEGTFTSGKGLPDDFPEDIPLVEGEVLQAASGGEAGKNGYVVMVKSSMQPDAASANAVKLLEGAGFTTGAEAQGTAGGFLDAKQLTRAPYSVIVAAYPAGDDTTAMQYIIAQD